MSYPILYSATETNFNHNGIGILSACVSCEVTEEANGAFELAMTYPMDGVHFAEIGDRAIIKAKADQFRDPQLFRVYAVSKPMSGIVTVLAAHISYDLSGIPVKPFSSSTAIGALAGLKSNAVVDCPFSFWTDKELSSTFRVEVPASIRSRLGGVAGSILDVYGGEYEFDNFTVKLHQNRGYNRGVSIRYGKNLTDIQQDQNCSNVATGIYPYWMKEAEDGTSELVELPEKIVNAPGTYNFVKIRTLDLSGEFENAPTIDQLRSKTQSYIKNNDIGVPSVSWSVSFEQLSKSEEYKHLALLERVSLFDTVNVEFPALNVSAIAKVVMLVYDGLAERVKSVTLGSVRSNIADTIVNQQKEIQKAPTKSDLRKAQEAATSWLTNGKGYAYFRKDESGNISDILFMDTQDAETAVDVMRVGQSGIGFSHNGVGGPYESAWTIDGNFVADFITTGTLDASLIKTGTLQSNDGKVSIDLAGGNKKMPTFNTGISTNGLNIRGDDAETETMFYVGCVRPAGSGTYYSLVEFKNVNGTTLHSLSEAFNENLVSNGLIAQYRNKNYGSGDNTGAVIQALHGDGTEKGSAAFNLVGNNGYLQGSYSIDKDMVVSLTTDKINGKSISWKSNGDGTYTLVGQ